jgi:hypothetical protein
MSRLQTNAIRHLGSAVDNLTLDNAGRVLMPNQPAFRARMSVGYTLTPTIVKFGVGLLTEIFDTTNNFNHSTATFQAPVAGVYLFSMQWAPNTAGRLSTNFYVNGSAGVGGSVSSSNAASASTIIKLAAGDTVEVYIQSLTGGNVDVDNTGIFYGYLLG